MNRYIEVKRCSDCPELLIHSEKPFCSILWKLIDDKFDDFPENCPLPSIIEKRDNKFKILTCCKILLIENKKMNAKQIAEYLNKTRMFSGSISSQHVQFVLRTAKRSGESLFYKDKDNMWGRL